VWWVDILSKSPYTCRFGNFEVRSFMKYIAVVGNIGSGKTSLTRLLSEHFNWKAEFESADDNPYLADFYADMKAWAFHLQIYFLNSRFAQVKNIQSNQVPVIQDRTIYEDAHIFARNLYLTGVMDERDFGNYKSIYESITHIIRPPDLLIYLQADLPKLQHQIHKRGRGYEADISLDYLNSLNKLYNEWIQSHQGSEIITFDMNHLDFVENSADLHHIIQTIQQHIGEPMPTI